MGKQFFAFALQMCFTRCKTERETSQIDADSFSVFKIYRNDVGPINLFAPRNWDFSSLSEASKFYLCVAMYHSVVTFNGITCFKLNSLTTNPNCDFCKIHFTG